MINSSIPIFFRSAARSKLTVFSILLCCILSLTLLKPVFANPTDDLLESRKIYLAAASCMAAYESRVGDSAFDALKQEGWEIDSYSHFQQKADAKFFIAHHQSPNGLPSYILSVAGTESGKDIGLDLRWEKVPFGGTNLTEFADTAALKPAPTNMPLVHKGFNDYVQVLLSTKITVKAGMEPQLLTDVLLAHPDAKLFLTGHSLGGAVVTLAAARLISMGVHPDQLEVMTFGAPAVGNQLFKDKMAASINLTRFINVGDQIPYAMNQLIGGYAHFGNETHWPVPEIITMHPHHIVVYMDYALKNYYNKRWALEKAGSPIPPEGDIITTNTNSCPKAYIANIGNFLETPLLQKEFPYMKAALLEEYDRICPSYVLGTDSTSDIDLLLAKAAESGCEYLVVPGLYGSKLKNKLNTYYITLAQPVYDVATGRTVLAETYATNTNSFTPTLALIRAIRTMSKTSAEWEKTAFPTE